jgi:hypothetical protein
MTRREHERKGETGPKSLRQAKQGVKSARPGKPPVEELENCTFLDTELVFSKESDAYPELKSQMKRFVEALDKKPLPKGLRSPIASGPKREPTSWRNVETLLANLHYIKAKRKSTVAVDLSPNKYADSALSSSGFINLMKLAEHYKFVILDKGFNNDEVWRPNRKARIKPTAKLIKLFETDLAEPQIIDALVTSPDELIKLKHTIREETLYWKHGALIPGEKKTKERVPRKEWEKTLTQDKKEELRSIEQSLESFNSLLKEYKITYLSRSDNYWHTLHPALFCSYSDDFKHGGRFYTGKGGHTNLSKMERKTIMYNGQPTVELDYGGLHIRILYHMAGTEYPWEDDPYKDVLQEMDKDYSQLQRDFGDEFAKEIRNDLKVMLLTLVGDKTKEHIKNPLDSAARKINFNLFRKWEKKTDPEKIEEEKRKNLKCKARWERAGLLNRNGSTYNVVEAFVGAHQPIEDYFLKGKAVELQNRDAQMALRVMNEMMVNENDICVPALPVHDSFITYSQYPYPQQLRAAMEKTYREVMQQVTNTDREFDIPIKPSEEEILRRSRIRA